MTALQTDPSLSSRAVSGELFGFTRDSSFSVPTENARDEEMPRRVITRASWTPHGASAAIVTTNLFGSASPSAPVFGFCGDPGRGENNPLAFSIFSPLIDDLHLRAHPSSHRHERQQARSGQADLLCEGSRNQPQGCGAGERGGQW